MTTINDPPVLVIVVALSQAVGHPDPAPITETAFDRVRVVFQLAEPAGTLTVSPLFAELIAD
jgi:hypothetical protein